MSSTTSEVTTSPIDQDFIIGIATPWDPSVEGETLPLETIEQVMEPLGSAVSAGVGWLIEHVDFLNKPLELLLGSASDIQAITDEWNAVAASLKESADKYTVTLNQVGEAWTGNASNSYRREAEKYIARLISAAELSERCAEGVMAAGLLVATTRGLLFTNLLSLMKQLIPEAISAVASSFVTAGVSIGKFLVSAAPLIMEAATLQYRLLGEVAKKLTEIVGKLDELGKLAEAAGQRVSQAANQLASLGRTLAETHAKLVTAPIRALPGLAETAEDLVGDVTDAGKDLASGLIDAGGDFASDIADAGEQAAKSAWSAIRDAL